MYDQQLSESAVLVGSSTHNERIEHLWRNVQRCVSVLFADLFREMESDAILNCLNEVDMFCLHRVFLPRINSALHSFVESWNNYPLTTSNNQTPNQLFIKGALRRNMAPTAHTPTHAPCSIHTPTAHDADDVPRCTFAPCGSLHQELGRLDMPRVTDDFGYSVYQTVCHVVGCHLQGCSNCS